VNDEQYTAEMEAAMAEFTALCDKYRDVWADCVMFLMAELETQIFIHSLLDADYEGPVQ
jgi:hypothetical protein